MDTKIFGLAEHALQVCEERASVLANNIVNSATPNFKARDFDFQKALQKAGETIGIEKTNQSHIALSNTNENQNLQYRIPMQTSTDGNTVDDDIERKNYVQNSLRYEISLTFIQNKAQGLMKAIKGE